MSFGAGIFVRTSAMQKTLSFIDYETAGLAKTAWDKHNYNHKASFSDLLSNVPPLGHPKRYVYH